MRAISATAFLLCTVLAAACGREAPNGDADASGANHAALIDGPCRGLGITASDAWIRAARAGQPTTAAYVTLCNGGEHSDALTSVTFSGAESVELHATTMNDEGVASMTPIEELALPPSGSASFSPGAAHIMLIDVNESLERGAEVELLLEFKNAPSLTVLFEVRDAIQTSHH